MALDDVFEAIGGRSSLILIKILKIDYPLKFDFELFLIASINGEKLSENLLKSGVKVGIIFFSTGTGRVQK